jgi:AmpD protein
MATILNVSLQSGLLEPVIYQPSPYFDDRPLNTSIDMVVIHGISLPPGQFGTSGVEDFFVGKLDLSLDPYYASISHLRVSSHLFIKRTGELVQFVPFSKRAWHAGQSYFQGKNNCNDFSIGIELEGTDDIPYEVRQYEQLVKTVQSLMLAYPGITQDRIVGHADIAPGRKTDPGPVFDWSYLRGKIA